MRSRDILLAEETLFRDVEVFDPDYMPEHFGYRDAQLREMAYALRPAARGSRAGSAFIVGPPATGKTTAVRLVLDDLRAAARNVVAVHVNCHIQPSIYRIFSEVHRAVFGHAPPDTGVPVTKIQEAVFARMAKSRKPLIVALDDINYLFANNTADDVLYSILRAHETYSGAKTAVFAIATDELLHKLDDKTRSIFSPARIEFRPYSQREAFEILRARRDAGLYGGVMSDALLERIVSRAADLRYGIELIKRSAIAAEADALRRIAPRHVEKALAAMQVRVEEDSASQLLAMIRDAPGESGALYRKYRKANKISYTTFHRMLKRLESSGRVEIKRISKNKGKTSLIRARQ